MAFAVVTWHIPIPSLGFASGLLVLEVKDWRLETIVSADKTKVELLTDRARGQDDEPAHPSADGRL